MKTFLASVAAIALMSGVAVAEGTQTADPAQGGAAASGTAAGSTAGSSAGTAAGASGESSAGTAAGSTAGATAGGASEVVITTTESEEYGKFLTDAEGRPVYILEAEDQAQGADASACEGECAQVWPPVLAEGDTPQAQGEADAGMLSMTERPDGTSQVTYDGKPLYYYEKDEGQAAPTGQDVHDEWGEWYLLQPTGETVEEE